MKKKKCMKQSRLARIIRTVSPLFFSLGLLFMGAFFPTPAHAAPIISNFTADITSFPFGGGTVKFTWSAQNVVKCGSLGAQNNFFTPVGNGGNSNGGGSFDIVVPITASIRLWCMDSGDAYVESQSILITVAEFAFAPNFTEFSSDQASLPAGGGTITLTWKVTGATSCAVAGGAFWASPLGGTIARPIAQTTTYTMTCSNAAGDSTKSMTVTVGGTGCVPNGACTAANTCNTTTCTTNCGVVISGTRVCGAGGPLPTLSFSGQTTIRKGESTTLQWTTNDATSCHKTGSWGTADIGGQSGTEIVTPNNAGTFNYYLYCFNAFGSTPHDLFGMGDRFTVFVTDAPVISSFTANPTPIDVGASSVLKWTVANVEACIVYKGATASNNVADVVWSGDITTTEKIVSPAASTSYTLQCSNSTPDPMVFGGPRSKVEKTILVKVNGPCIPNGACTAANTCNTTTCTTNCGVVISGTKDCSVGGGGNGGVGGNGGGVVTGGLIPCGKSFGSAAEQAPCTVCHLIVGGNNLIKWGLGIMSVIAITVMFAMAVLYVVSAGNPGMMQTAKGGIFAVLIGFGVMLSAWLIINTVLTILVNNADNTKPLGGLVQQGVFKFSCDTTSNVGK